jgi:hypothetical protein
LATRRPPQHALIDLQADDRPRGGAAVTQIMPGETGTFEWKPLNPGLYVYHCATPLVPGVVVSGDARPDIFRLLAPDIAARTACGH